MKKLILVLAILLTVPAFGALSLTLTQTGKSVDVNYTGADPCNLPRAFALVVEINSTADVNGISNYKTDGVSTAASPGFGIYPATISIDGNNGSVASYGNPLAVQGAVGAYQQVLPSQKFVLEFGSLYAPVGDSVNAPATSGRLCTLTFDCNGSSSCTLKVSEEDTYRGGIVLENGTTPDPNLTASLVLTGCAPSECLKSTASYYADWVTYGKPACWCYQRQCRGDINGSIQGSFWVYTQDLTLLQAAFGQRTLPDGGICADLNHSAQGSFRVYTQDLAILQTYFGQRDVPVCDSNMVNFWTN